MALTDTARLAVELNLAGNFGAGVARAEGQLGGLNRAASGAGTSSGRLSGALGKVEGAAGRFGGALGHAGSQLKSLAFGPLGMIGVTGGLLTLGGAIEQGISKAQEFGGEVRKLSALTDMSTESTSALAAAFDHFGISAEQTIKIAGFFEKTMGKLNDTTATAGASSAQLQKAQENVTKAHERLTLATIKLNETEAKKKVSASQLTAAQIKVRDATVALTDAEQKLADVQANKAGISTSKAMDLQKKFGVQLLDSRGKALDFGTVLLNVADYYNSNAQASDKAQLAAQLFGRGYVQLIPILKAGRQGILDAEQAAKDFGLTLTADNIQALAKAKQATRDWGDALGGLELQIGLALLPSLTDLTKTATQFVSQNRNQIVGFFKEGAKWAGELGKAIKDYVIPVFGAIKSGWDTVPDDFKKLIIGGAILGKTSKFLFNVGPIDILKGVGGAFFSRGSPVNPMWVRQVGLPGVPGGGGLPIPGGGGLSTLAKVALVGEAIGLVAAVEGVREAVGDRNSKIAGAIADQTTQYLAQTPSKADLLNSLAAVDKGISDIRSNPLNVLVQGDALDKLTQMRDAIQKQINTASPADQLAAQQGMGALGLMAAAQQEQVRGRAALQRGFGILTGILGKPLKLDPTALRSSLDPLIAALKGAKEATEIRRAADALAAAIKAQQGRGALTAGTAGLGVKELKDSLVALQAKQAQALKVGNTALAAALGKDIRAVEKKLPERAFVAKELATEEQILRSSESSKQKLSDLTGIQRALQQHGDTKAAAIVSRAIADMKNRLARTTAQAGEVAAAAIRHKKQLVDVNVQNTISVSTTVSARQVRTAEVVVQRYGTNRIGWT